MTRTGHRPNGAHESAEEKTTGGSGSNTSRGPAKRVEQAHLTAPDSADRDLIEAVAFRAIREDIHPADLWLEVVDDRTAGHQEADAA